MDLIWENKIKLVKRNVRWEYFVKRTGGDRKIMCGRYYVDNETEIEIEKIVRNLDRKRQAAHRGDIYPTNHAMVLREENRQTVLTDMYWGFPQYQKKGVIFNARSESVLEKRMFSDSTLHRRCLIPAKGFYEWDRTKNKITFERPDKHVMMMAGIWNYYDPEQRFVILTTEANASMAPVHDRMPLILEPDEADMWLHDDKSVEFLLHKRPAELDRVDGFLQETLQFK